MKKIILVNLFLVATGISFGQKQTFDLITYTPPGGSGWTKEIKKAVTSYTYIDEKDKSWCQMGIYKSTVSKGNIDADFDSEWETLVKKQFNTIDTPNTNMQQAEGWDIKSGAGKFIFKNKETMVLLTTFSGHGVCLSIVATTPNQRYMKNIEELMASIELNTPVAQTNNEQTGSWDNTVVPVSKGFTFTSTNFDDGWTSVVKEDWVEVTKGDIKVLLHYPKAGTVFPADPEPLTNAAWNILVAPRYSNLKNYKTTYISGYERSTLGFGNATDNASGKQVFVLLLRKGSSPWIEFIAPHKASFMQSFNFDPYTIQWNSEGSLLDPLMNMVAYNKFAISMSDFTGKWADKFSSNTYYANVYTGESAGMSTYTSSQSFEFSGDTYKWNLVAINSYGGQAKFGQGKGNGTFKVLNNWQIYFSEMEGKPKTFDAYFSATKGGRVLWMNDAQYPGSGIFTGFSKQ